MLSSEAESQPWLAAFLSALALVVALMWALASWRGPQSRVPADDDGGLAAPQRTLSGFSVPDGRNGIVCYVKRKSLELKEKWGGGPKTGGLVMTEYLGTGSCGKVYAGTYKGQPVAARLVTFPSTPTHAWRLGAMYKVLRARAGSHPNLVPLIHVEVNPGLQDNSMFGPEWGAVPHITSSRSSNDACVEAAHSATQARPPPHRVSSLLRLAASAMGSLVGRSSLDERSPERLQHVARAAARTGRASADSPTASSKESWRVTLRRPTASFTNAHATSTRVRDAFSTPELSLASTPPRVPPIHMNEIYLLSELCPCGSLDELLRQRLGLSWAARALLACDVAHALVHLHDRRIMHADIKSASVIMVAAPERTELGMRAKLSDTGLAALLDMDEARLSCLRSPPEVLVMQSPEALIEGTLSLENDIYQYGCLLWQLACPDTSMVAAGASSSHVLQQLVVCHSRPPFPGDTPAAWAALAAQCWAPNPAARPIARDVLTQVQVLTQQLGSDS